MAANHSGGLFDFKAHAQKPDGIPCKVARHGGKALTAKHFVVLSTAPDEASAAALARALVEEGLAACVNRVSGVRSTYRWQGRIVDDAEWLLVIKTSAERLATLCARLEALHPYDVPEVVALPIVAGAERYLAWLGQIGADIDPGGPRDP